jgi:protein-tyrosine phosphatase
MDTDVAERLVPLEGGINFRDLGGYPAADGRRIKWRHLYRSGSMARLTEADYTALAERGIRHVVDLRSTREQIENPNLWVRHAGIGYWSRDHSEAFANLHAMVDRGLATEAEAEAVMIAGYRHVPVQQAPGYAEIFRALAAGEVPLAFNCTAGKDRAGSGAALVLAALGVPHEVIAGDFAMTNRAVDFEKAFGAQKTPNASRYAALPAEVSAAIRQARPHYVLALLDAVEADFGGIAGYLQHLGFSAADHRAMEQAVLE